MGKGASLSPCLSEIEGGAPVLLPKLLKPEAFMSQAGWFSGRLIWFVAGSSRAGNMGRTAGFLPAPFPV